MEKTKLNTSDTIWDVVVVGGGPAGMMASLQASRRGKKVLLLEKNETLGKKLLITGGGRCNLTNNKKDNRILLAKYKGNDQFLYSAFTQWNVKNTLDFFHTSGMLTKEENEGRVFPVSNKAESVFNVLYEHMKESGVTIQPQSAVTGITHNEKRKCFDIKIKGGTRVYANACIVATGGTSRPETGSTGEGFLWLKKLGHTIITPDVSLVPIVLRDVWTKKVSGLTLPDIKITTFQNNQKQESRKGKILFTHTGLSGPTILNMSSEIAELLKYGEVTIVLDLFPHLDIPDLKKQLQRILVEESNKKLKNILGKLIPASLVSPLLEQIPIDGEVFAHSVRSEDRTALTVFLKSIPLHVKELLGKNKAIISSGGVDLREVNFKTMESRVVQNLYLIGDVLNIDRPSGGYSLQLSWTTGVVAGRSV